MSNLSKPQTLFTFTSVKGETLSITNTEEVPYSVIEAVAYYLGVYPAITIDVVVKKVSKSLPKFSIKPALVEYVIIQFDSLIDIYRTKGKEALDKGVELDDLPYGSLLDRAKFLMEIMSMGKEGYDEEIPQKDGVALVRRKNLSAALEASKQLDQLLDKIALQDSDFQEANWLEVKLDAKFIEPAVEV